jgi:hypothetical protein
LQADLAHLYPAYSWSLRARAFDLIDGPEGQKGHLITNALARPFLHAAVAIALKAWIGDDLT